jgi:hypothetical protein
VWSRVWGEYRGGGEGSGEELFVCVCVCVRVCEIGRRRKAEVAMKRRG